MLHLVRATGLLEDRHFREVPDLLRADDLVIFNNTRVFPARLYGRRSGAHAQPVSAKNRAAKEFLKGRVEVLLTAPEPESSRLSGSETSLHAKDAEAVPADHRPPIAENPLVWNALVRPGRKIGVGEKLFFGDHDELRAEIIARRDFGERTLRFEPVSDFFAVVEK